LDRNKDFQSGRTFRKSDRASESYWCTDSSAMAQLALRFDAIAALRANSW
jgi:hypothetical protein